eukprot:9471456-Pyramimonas_sp.AAC.2
MPPRSPSKEGAEMNAALKGPGPMCHSTFAQQMKNALGGFERALGGIQGRQGDNEKRILGPSRAFLGSS